MTRWVILPTETFFVSQVNCSPSFVRKCRKSWLAQGISGRLVTLLPAASIQVNCDEQKRRTVLPIFSLHKNIAKITIFTKATGYYFRKGDYWSFDWFN